MKLAVLGATGRAGRHVVREALARGWTVRALARDPAKIDDPRVVVVRGEAGDAAAVDALVQGSDAVVSALGVVKGGPTDVCSSGTRNVLAAMKRHGVKRYVVLGGAGSRAPGERKPLSGAFISWLTRTAAPGLVADKEDELAQLADSDVEWTAARPPMIAEAPARGVRVDARGPPSVRVAYADVAKFLVDEVEARRHVRATPYVSW